MNDNSERGCSDEGVWIRPTQLFNNFIRTDHRVEHLEMIDAPLPVDQTTLRYLQALCLIESRKALEAGHHFEGRRLGNLAYQFQRRAEQASPPR